MATAWSSYVNLGGYSVRVGVEATWSGGVLSWKGMAQLSGSSVFGNDPWAVSGEVSGSGTKSWSINSNGGITTIASGTKAKAQTYSAQTVQVTFQLSQIADSSYSRSATVSLTIPALPYDAPADPSNLTVTRNSDTRHTLTWTRNATTTAPYTQIEVLRRPPGGSWAVIASLAGSATSYVDTSTRADRSYRYGVRAKNSGGNSGIVYTDFQDTTPAAPGAPSIAKNASGGIVVTRPALSAVATHWEVWHAADGVWDGARLALVAAGTSSWTHDAPDPAKTHTYRLRAVTDTPVLYSAYGPSSTTVQLIAPPLAPSRLAPSVGDADAPIVLSWQHNAADGTMQTFYEIEHAEVGGALTSWSTLAAKTAASAGAHTVPAGTWTNGEQRQVRFRTWGEHADPGAWSAPLVLTLSAAPTAGITSPEPVHPSPEVVVAWTFHDPESSAQAAWQVVLSADGQAVETRTGTGASARSVRLNTTVADGGTYTATVTVRDGAGVWSAPASQTFTVAYAPPATPVLDASWRPDDGHAVLSVEVPDTPGVEELDHVRVERAMPAGWTTVADDLESGQSLVDPIPPVGQVVTYRAVAVSVTGSVAYSTDVPVDTGAGEAWVFINYGPSFSRAVRLQSNVDASRETSRHKVLHHLAGRPDPVERAGQARSRTFSLSATLWEPCSLPGQRDDQSGWDDLQDLAEALAPVCLRGPHGLREFCSVGAVSQSGIYQIDGRASISLTRVHWTEDTAP